MAEKNIITVRAKYNMYVFKLGDLKEQQSFTENNTYDCTVIGVDWETVDDTGVKHIIHGLKHCFDIVTPEEVPKPIAENEDMHLPGQFLLLREIQQLGYNIVTCGNCGDVLIHKTIDEVVLCPHCGYESDPCDFPDLFY